MLIGYGPVMEDQFAFVKLCALIHSMGGLNWFLEIMAVITRILLYEKIYTVWL